MNKTPITVLQELMTKYQEIPSYECIAQTGPQHLSVFEYRCVAHGVTAHGVARSKKEAKQEAARRALAALAARGISVPPQYRTAPEPSPVLPNSTTLLPLPSNEESQNAEGQSGAVTRVDARNSVALLKELCEEYRLGAVKYDLVGDTGPPHLRMFSIRASLAGHERLATATTKKAARQKAAEQLYSYLRENLANATKDFVENRRADLLKEQTTSEKCPENDGAMLSPRKRKTTDEVTEELQSKRCCTDEPVEEVIIAKENEDALSRALDKAMLRYVELREEHPWRPDLGQRIADYHLGEEQREAAERAAADESEDSAAVLQQTAAALGLTVELSSLPTDQGALSVISLSPTAPTLSLAGVDPPSAARAALRYLRRALRQRPGFPDDVTTLGPVNAF